MLKLKYSMKAEATSTKSSLTLKSHTSLKEIPYEVYFCILVTVLIKTEATFC